MRKALFCIFIVLIISCAKKEIVPKKTKGTLGIIVEDLCAKDKRFLSLPGVLITDILSNSAAAKAEVPLFSVITHIDGNPIRSKVEYDMYTETLEVGEIVNVAVLQYFHKSQMLYELEAKAGIEQLHNHYTNVYNRMDYKEYPLKDMYLWDFDYFSEMKSFITKMTIDMRRIEIFFEIQNCSDEDKYFSIKEIISNVKDQKFYKLNGLEHHDVITIPKQIGKQPSKFLFSISLERPIEYLLLTGSYETCKYKCVFQFEEHIRLNTYCPQEINLKSFNYSVNVFPYYFTASGAVGTSEIVLDSPKFDTNNSITTDKKSIIFEGTVYDTLGVNEIIINNKNVVFDEFGNFHHNQYLIMGTNKIDITIININQEETKESYTIIRTPQNISEDFVYIKKPIETENYNPFDIAVVIGIEDYSKNPDVLYARDDASVVFDYLISTFGLKQENIKILTDGDASLASFREIFSENGWLNANSSEQANVYIYYSGHGYVDESGNSYLIPYDSMLGFLDTAYPVEQIYNRIAKLDVKSRNVILDACFSGYNKDGSTISETKMLVVEQVGPPQNINLFTSCSNNELSNIFKEANQSLYTYYWLKGIRGDADLDLNNLITYREMDRYLKDKVPKKSRRLYRIQNPQLYCQSLEDVFIDLGDKNEE